jgi:exosortase A
MREFRGLRPALPAILLGVLCLGLLFLPEATAAFQVWESSTAYNHCFLILPIVLWLIWERRYNLCGLGPEPTAFALIPCGIFLIFWFIAERLGVMEGRQLAALGILQAMLLGILGWRVYRIFVAGFIYLFFLVPFGGFLVPALQSFTTRFTVLGLDVLGIPNYASDFTIQITAGSFQIADACAGLRFLIAAVAFSVFYALLLFQSIGRRLMFILLSAIVPVVANGFRALGIVWLGAKLGSAQAAATDHVLYGYIFFSFVLGLLILLGLPFRQDQAPRLTMSSIAEDDRSSTWVPLSVAVMIIIVTSIGLLTVAHLNKAAAAGALPPVTQVQGCEAGREVDTPAIKKVRGRSETFLCENKTIVVTVVSFPPNTDPKIIFDTKQQLGGEDDLDASVSTMALSSGKIHDWEVTSSPDSQYTICSTLIINRRSSFGNLMTRFRQAWLSVAGGSDAPLIVVGSTISRDNFSATELIQFIEDRPGFTYDTADPAVHR